MSVNRIQGNISFPNAASSCYVGTRNRLGFWAIIKAMGGAINKWTQKPVIAWGRNVNPMAPPAESLERVLRTISNLAKEGLQRAERGGFKEDSALARAHIELLNERCRRTLSIDPRVNPELVGPVADLRNSQVTRAIDLEARVATTDWKMKTEFYRTDLCRKLSVFAGFMQMQAYAGIPEEDSLNLLQMTDIATKEGETRSLWQIFNDQYKDLTWVQKIMAGLVYWLGLKTSLISNTVEAYVKSFIEATTKDLTSENDQTRLAIIKEILENVNEFLVEDIAATRAFAHAATLDGIGDLEKVRKRTIEAHYHGSLQKLCRKFSQTRVEKDHPNVIFFENLQKIPVIGLLFKALQWILNRFIIQISMKSFILPQALKSGVEIGLETTQPYNRPFILAETRFLTQQLESLSLELDKPPSKTPPQLPGTEILFPVIKHLKIVLDLEDFKTQSELKQKFAEIEAGKWFMDRKLEEIIQEGIQEGGHYLFDYLNKTAKSSELTAHIMELSCACFSNQTQDPVVLEAELKEEQLKLERVANDVFKKLIRSAVATIFESTKPEDAKKMAEEVFKDACTIAKVSSQKLQQLCGQMTKKVQRAQIPSPNNNIQKEITEFLQIMQVFSGRKELQEKIDELEPLDREAIWRSLKPFIEQVVKLGEKILILQTLQSDHTAHAVIVDQLKFIAEFLELVHREFKQEPQHMHNPLKTTLEKPIEEISCHLGLAAPVTLELKGFACSLSNLSNRIVHEEHILNALHKFYPPRKEGEQVEQEGLLDQLVNYERGIHPPRFQLMTALNTIDELLAPFPLEEQNELRELIGNGLNLEAKWTQLGVAFQRIYQNHFENQKRDSAQFDEILKEKKEWTRKIIESYTLIKEKDFSGLKNTMKEISDEMITLQGAAHTIQLNLPFHLTSKQTKGVSALAGFAAGSGALTGVFGWLGNFFGPVGIAAGIGLGAAAKAVVIVGPGNIGSIGAQKPTAYARTSAWLVGSVAASYFLPGWTNMLFGSLRGATSGWNAEKLVHAYSQDKVLPEVEAIFKKVYKLCLSPRIYHAATTRILKALSGPERI